MNSSHIVKQEDFESLAAYYTNPDTHLKWDLVFTLPAWLKVWWKNFGAGAELCIRSFWDDDKLIGIAPLQVRHGTASFIGNTDVCDYQDFIVVPGKEKEFSSAILDYLQSNNIRDIHLETIRPDSNVVTHLMPLAEERQLNVDYKQTDVSSDIDLPASWDNYLQMLDSKQRHEIKRKMKNLQALVETNYKSLEGPVVIPGAIDAFLKLFPESRGDKAQFMTSDMQNYFRELASALTGVVKFGLLEAGQKPLAMVMYFDYNDNIYLYNSAYDPDYRSMSVGIISKSRCIQDSIEKGKRKFDFLKGAEQYKYYMGGKEIPLYSCHISLK